MMNNVIAIGKLQKIVDFGEYAIITIANQETFKNKDGEYKINYIDFIIYGGIKDNLIEYCKQGDTIACRGFIRTENEETEKETKLIADKISFLSTNKKGE